MPIVERQGHEAKKKSSFAQAASRTYPALLRKTGIWKREKLDLGTSGEGKIELKRNF
jgi:hypothetical protein